MPSAGLRSGKEGKMSRWFALILLFAVSFAPGPFLRGAGAGYSGMYGTEGLESGYRMYHHDLYRLWIDDLRINFTIPETIAAADIRFKMPLVGDEKFPLDYYSDPDERVVIIPVLTVSFFRDLAIAEAWFERRRCDTSVVLDYVDIIASRAPSEFPGGRYPNPLEALGIPEKALSDRRVQVVADEYLRTVLTFIMAHEFGHALAEHSGLGDVSAQRAMAQEVEADGFAMDMMTRIPRLPTGLPLFFRAASRFMRPPADFASAADYESYLQGNVTDPLSGERMAALAGAIRKNAGHFISVTDDQTRRREEIFRLADEIESIGEAIKTRPLGGALRSGSLEGAIGARPAGAMRSGAAVTRERVSVLENGDIAFGSEMVKRHGLSRFKWISLYYNRRTKEVAMEFHEEQVSGALKLGASDSPDEEYPLKVSAAGFFKTYDIDHGSADGYPARYTYTEKDHWLVFKVGPGPLVTGNAAAAAGGSDGAGGGLVIEELSHACD